MMAHIEKTEVGRPGYFIEEGSQYIPFQGDSRLIAPDKAVKACRKACLFQGFFMAFRDFPDFSFCLFQDFLPVFAVGNNPHGTLDGCLQAISFISEQNHIRSFFVSQSQFFIGNDFFRRLQPALPGLDGSGNRIFFICPSIPGPAFGKVFKAGGQGFFRQFPFPFLIVLRQLFPLAFIGPVFRVGSGKIGGSLFFFPGRFFRRFLPVLNEMVDPGHLFLNGIGISIFFRNIFQSPHLCLRIPELRNGPHIGAGLVLLIKVVGIIVVQGRFSCLFFRPFHHGFRRKVLIPLCRGRMMDGTAHGAGQAFFKRSCQDGGLAGVVGLTDFFIILPGPVPLGHTFFGRFFQICHLFYRFIEFDGKPVHFPFRSPIGFGLRLPADEFCHTDPELSDFIGLFFQTFRFGRKGCFFFLCPISPSCRIVQLAAHGQTVVSDFFQIFEIGRQLFGAPDAGKVFFCFFNLFFVPEKEGLFVFCLVQIHEMAVKESCLLVPIPEIVVILFRPVLSCFRLGDLFPDFRNLIFQIFFILGSCHAEGGREFRFFILLPALENFQVGKEFILEIGEPAGLEELFQDGFPLFCLGHEEFPEIALGQENDLTELVRIETEQLRGSFLHIFRDGPDFLPLFQLGERSLHGHFFEAFAPDFVQHLFRAPGGAIGLPPDFKVKNDFRLLGARGIVAPHMASRPVSAGPAVKGIAHGIENGRLPRSRGSADEEKMAAFQFVEINDRFSRIGPEGAHGKFQWFHFSASPA